MVTPTATLVPLGPSKSGSTTSDPGVGGTVGNAVGGEVSWGVGTLVGTEIGGGSSAKALTMTNAKDRPMIHKCRLLMARGVGSDT